MRSAVSKWFPTSVPTPLSTPPSRYTTITSSLCNKTTSEKQVSNVLDVCCTKEKPPALSQDSLNKYMKILEKYPEHTPVILTRAARTDPDIPVLPKNKFLVLKEYTVGQFIYTVRQRLRIGKEKAIFLIVNGNIIPATDTLMSTLYKDHCNFQGILHMEYTGETAFG